MARFENVSLSEDRAAVVIVDQTRLPAQLIHITLRTGEEMLEAIASLRVRGAPAIGIFAAYCIFCLAQQIAATDEEGFLAAFRKEKDRLRSTRPTAVNLQWALDRMERVVTGNRGKPTGAVVDMLGREAERIQEEDAAMCLAIAEYGLTLVRDGDGLLTHCNAGPLATSRYGTALGPVLLGKERGLRLSVFACETRPLLQGARLTVYELSKAGIDVTLICDNMASAVMQNGWINACFVGCDRIAANGDTANKIGTSGLAILARHYGVPFYVLGPTTTIDMACADGGAIEIEQRPADEIRDLHFREPIAPQQAKCYNPAFDVTAHSLISGIVTEKGICRPPFGRSLAAVCSRP